MATSAPGPQVSACTDPVLGARILSHDYSDAPVRYFSRGLIRSLARSWARGAADVFFLVAHQDGQYAGFVVAHARGRRFWRSIAGEHPRHAVSWFLAWARTRRSQQARSASGSPAVAGSVHVPSVPEPFGWSAGDRVGVVELIVVRPEFRGRGIAGALLRAAEIEAARAHAPFMEAHIDAGNEASLRAFLRAGWQVRRMIAGDYHAMKAIEPA